MLRNETQAALHDLLEAESGIERLARRAAELVAGPASRQLLEKIGHDAEETRRRLSSFAAF